MADINEIIMCNGEKPSRILYNSAYTKTIPEVIDYYKYASDAGGYYVRGLWLAPAYTWGTPYWWPWDLGVPGGALKDKNDGWRYWGIVYDGNNKNLTTGINKTFPSNGYSFYGVCLCLYYNTSNYTDESGRACLDFGDKPIVVTFKDGRFDNFEWSNHNDGSVYEWSEDKRTITIYRVGTTKTVCYIKYTDDISINRVRQLLTDVYVDISNLEYYTTSYTEYDPSRIECWKVYKKDEIIYNKDKTVENCLLEYFGTKDGDGVITISDSSNGDLILPDISEVIDIQDYDTDSLKISGSSTETSESYVEWLNQGYEKNLENKTDALQDMILDGHYGCVKCNNTSENPVKIYVPLGGDESYVANGYQASDRLTFDDALGGSDVNYLQVIFKDRGLAYKCDISTTMRTFQKLKCKEFEIIHEEADGTVVYPYKAKWGLRPYQLRAAFEGCNLSVIKREWMDWSRVTMMPYGFDVCTNLTEIQSNGETCTFFPHNVSKDAAQGSEEDTEGANYLWPNFINGYPEVWDASYAFWGDKNLKRIEPILDVHWWANPNMYSYMFTKASNVEYVKLKGLNCMNWDFTSDDLYLPKLNQECIEYLFENLEDQISKPYTETNVNTSNINSSYPDVYYDHKNIRTSRSINELTLTVPPEWMGLCFTDNHGWTIYSTGGGTLVNDKQVTLTSRYAESESALRGAICSNDLTNLTFKVEGLVEGDSLAVGGIGYLAAQSNVFTEDGTYTVSGTSNIGFGLYNSVDTTLTDAVTITLISCDEYPSKISDEMIADANAKGWKVVCLGLETATYSVPYVYLTYDTTTAAAGSVNPTYSYSQVKTYPSGTTETITSGGTLTFSETTDNINATVDSSTGIVTWAANTDTTASRSCEVTLTVTLNGQTNSVTALSVQSADTATTITYGTPTITSFTVDDIPASGGTVSSGDVTYSQSRTLNYASGNTASLSALTSGGTVTYSNAVTASSLEKTVKDRSSVGTLTATVTMNGKSASNTTTVYLQANEASYGTVTLSVDYLPKSVGASGGTVAVDTLSAIQEITYTSGAVQEYQMTVNTNDIVTWDDVDLVWKLNIDSKGTTVSAPTTNYYDIATFIGLGEVEETATISVIQARNDVKLFNITNTTLSYPVATAAGGTLEYNNTAGDPFLHECEVTFDSGSVLNTAIIDGAIQGVGGTVTLTNGIYSVDSSASVNGMKVVIPSLSNKIGEGPTYLFLYEVLACYTSSVNTSLEDIWSNDAMYVEFDISVSQESNYVTAVNLSSSYSYEVEIDDGAEYVPAEGGIFDFYGSGGDINQMGTTLTFASGTTSSTFENLDSTNPGSLEVYRTTDISSTVAKLLEDDHTKIMISANMGTSERSIGDCGVYSSMKFTNPSGTPSEYAEVYSPEIEGNVMEVYQRASVPILKMEDTYYIGETYNVEYGDAVRTRVVTLYSNIGENDWDAYDVYSSSGAVTTYELGSSNGLTTLEVTLDLTKVGLGDSIDIIALLSSLTTGNLYENTYTITFGEQD